MGDIKPSALKDSGASVPPAGGATTTRGGRARLFMLYIYADFCFKERIDFPSRNNYLGESAVATQM